MHPACTLDGMSKAVQIRGVPDGVHATLRSRAAAAGLSLSDYLRREVTLMAERPTMTEALARLDERADDGAVQVSTGQIVAAVRTERSVH